MKTRIHCILVPLLLLATFTAFYVAQPTTAFAQGTAFTYQGRLNDGLNPATGIYDLRFAIYDSTNSPGTLIAGPITNAATGVTNGLFSVALDFGANVFTDPDRWLDIGVRTNNGGNFSTLTPRQHITPTPYAISSGNVIGSVAASQLSGAVSLANLPTTLLVTNGQTGVNLTGTFSGNGAGVTNVNFLTLNSYGAITWPNSFVVSSSPGVGSYPFSVAAADVNGDGKVDLICANRDSGTLSVLFNAPSYTGIFLGDGSGLMNAAGWVRNGASIGYNIGYVGIGTTAPTEPLHLLMDQSATGVSGMRIENINPTAAGEHTVYLDLENVDPSSARTYRLQNVGNSSGRSGNFEIYDTAVGARLAIAPNGNVGIGNTSPGHLLVVGTGGAYCDGTTWVNGSDRNSKRDFTAVNPADVLQKITALPITEWQYQTEPDGVKHLGPMAQDFHEAFGLNGSDDKHISTVDEAGVALAAIQGLNQKLIEKDTEIQDLKRQSDSLAKQLNQLESVVKSLADRQ